MVAGSDKKDVVEVLVLACAPMNSRQLASPDNTFSTGERVYHFNMWTLWPRVAGQTSWW